jgi:predicted nucleic acid-binding Zn ribbon protein
MSHTDPAASADAPTAACVRCGRPIPSDLSMCEDCNPLGVSQPSTSQAHGTVFLGIILAVVALALAGRLALAGIGPFEVEVAKVATAGDGLAVTLNVRNTGTSAGTTRCRITDPEKRGTGPAAFVLSPVVQPGAAVEFDAALTQFGTTPKTLDADCHSP